MLTVSQPIPDGRIVPSPSRSRAQDALQSASAAASSPSRSGYLGVFGSASPPKASSWFGRSASRSRSRVDGETLHGVSKNASPSKARPSVSREPSKDAAAKSPQRNAHDANARSISVSPGKRKVQSPAKSPAKSQTQTQTQSSPTNQTAWESLWSLDFGVEEGKRV